MWEWPTFLELVECRPDAFFIQQIQWLAPGPGMVKFNIDGCSKGNPGVSGGGGILRNSAGCMVFAFSGYLGRCTNLQAEAKALLIGLQLCVQRGFMGNLMVETDSLLLQRILSRSYRCPWSIRGEVGKIEQVTRGGLQITYCYREANKVSDVLANAGSAHLYHLGCIYDSVAGLPTMARGEYQMDKLACWSLSTLLQI